MADATITTPSDPITGINLRHLSLRMTPRIAVLTFVYVHESGRESEEMTVTVQGTRANQWIAAWTQANPVRKMIANLREGGELTGVLET